MKTAIQTSIILAVALLVALLAYAIGSSESIQKLAPQSGGGGGLGRNAGLEHDAEGEEHAEGLGGGGGGGRHNHVQEGVDSSFALTGFLKTLVPLAMIILLITLSQNVYSQTKETQETMKKVRERKKT